MLADHTLDGGLHQDKITFPKLVLPKYDGIRVYHRAGRAYNRSGKLVPNSWLHTQLASLPDGVEGEVVVNDNFADTTSALRSFDKRDYDFKFYLFDNTNPFRVDDQYLTRLQSLLNLVETVDDKRIVRAEYDFVTSLGELLQLESDYVAQGMEGVILRDPVAKYKFGRATFKEQSYLSMKRSMTDTAVIIGYKCKLEDGAPVDTLGALELECNGVTFHCGSGLDDTTRLLLWAKQDELIGKSVEFKYQKSEQTAPRFPVFLRLL
jgi:ATP-dependent DNA ligase